MVERFARWSAIFNVGLLLSPWNGFPQVTPELIEAAKKEGEVIFYGAVTVNISKRISDLFEKKYGVPVRHWRGDATEIINRVLTEPEPAGRLST
jgi:hypothetical protein